MNRHAFVEGQRRPRRRFHSRPRMNARLAVAVAWAFGVLCLFEVPKAAAFCGFYVNGAGAEMFNGATQVVLMRKGTRTVLSMQNNYQGPPENFAMVVPVPVVLQKEQVKTLDKQIFTRVDSLAAPRLVEYWEQDPCAPMVVAESMALATGAPMARRRSASKSADLGVTIEAQFKVGEYEVVILSATDSAGLDTWLRQEKYQIPPGAEPLLRPYVQSGSKFFVAKVDTAKVKFKDGMATLSPLRFHYDSEEFSLPVRLGMINSSGTQDLIVHILAPGQRYEVANYKNATIPTNLEVKNETRDRFAEFYAALFDRTLEANPGAVITEYAWDASTCDPCPTPALNPGELATLGYDVLDAPLPAPKPSTSAPASSTAARPGKARDAVDELVVARPAPRRSRRRFPSGFVLTRLHARYQKGALADDLVFRAAGPIVGGREVPGASGTLEQGANPGPRNTFQGRYIIRHAWTGAVACDNPRRGIWGGPPGGVRKPTPKPALELAFAPRGQVRLASFVSGEIPGLPASALQAVSADGADGAAGGSDGSSAGGAAPAPVTPEPAKAKTAKGCQAVGGDSASGVWWLVALVALYWRQRKSTATELT